MGTSATQGDSMNIITEAIVYAIMWLAQIIMGDQT